MARKGLQGYIEKIDFLQLVAVCENAIDLNQVMKQQQADLLFLDIEMPYMTGIELAKTLPAAPRVIFTTAYDKYALQGFELEVLDYLLKPISFERFLKAANKAYDYFRMNEGAGQQQDHFFVKADNKLEKVRFDEILFIEALENYVGIYNTQGKKIITHSTLKALQEKLPQQQFIQPHKSYLVAIDKINAIEGNMLHVRHYQVPISKYLKDAVLERIVNNTLLKKS